MRAEPPAHRIALMRMAEAPAGPAGGAASLLRLGWDVILLVKDLAADPRVPRREKVAASAAAAAVALPLNLMHGRIRGLRRLDEALALGIATRRLLRAAGFDVIYQLWRGSDDGLAMILTLAGVER